MADSESDDSDAEGGLGNVSRIVMRPPGHSGKAKKGHLCFDASFETGNLGKVDLVSDFEYDLYIRPDTCNPYHRMWFNFVVDNTKLDQRVMLHIVNISKIRNLYCDEMTPLIKSTSRKKWSRMPSQQVYFYRSPYHNNNYVLTLTFCFDKEEESYQFAYSYPYSYSKLQAYLEHVESKRFSYFKRDSLGDTLQKRRIEMVTITNSINLQTVDKKPKIVVIVSRIHPGDSPTSYICQGIMDFLVSNHPLAVKLREEVIFKIFPMMNPDGVVLGNFRSNLLGADFDRNWNKISQWLHPPLHAILKTIVTLNDDENSELDFVVDLHAHCTLRGIFVHGNTYHDVYRHERHTLFPKLLSQNVDGYELSLCKFNRDGQRRGSCRRFLSNLRPTLNCYSIYASFHNYINKSTKKKIHFNEESYHRLGRNIVRTFSDYYTYMGVIPSAAKTQRVSSSLQFSISKRRKKPKHVFSKLRRKIFKRRCPRRKTGPVTDTKASKEVTSVKLESKFDVKKGHVDFSFVSFPTLDQNAKLRRQFATTKYRHRYDRSLLDRRGVRLSSDIDDALNIQKICRSLETL